MRRDTFSQYATEKIGLIVQVLNEDTDPVGNAVTVTITREADATVVVNAAAATREAEGVYSYIFSTDVTSVQGDYNAVWSFDVVTPAVSSPDPKLVTFQFSVMGQQTYFDSLDAIQRQLVENVYHHVSDLFDSTLGGPYLWELPQSRFNFETVAKLMVIDAMTYINFASPKAFIPPFTVGAATGARVFPAGWYGLLEKATLYELFKHLATSYLEIPEPVGVDVAYLDRRAYFDKWMKRAEMEKEALDHMIKMLKRDLRFGVKSRSLLVAGGIFPVSYLNPARPRWPYVLSRFY
jgi:hypothetical protein